MKIGLVNRDAFFDSNRAFKLGLVPDGIADSWHYLKNDLKALGHAFNTVETLDMAINCDILIFNEYPKKNSAKSKFLKIKNKKYLFLAESSLVIPENYLLSNFDDFIKIFTWSDDLISLGGKFIKCNFSVPIKYLFNSNVEIINNPRERDLCMVAANKLINRPGELYSYRREIIKYFDNNDDLTFDLYGGGWNKFKTSSHSIYGKVLNRLLKDVNMKPPNTWRGRIDSKLDAYYNSNFSFAIENAYKLPGYITEKIIHSLIGLSKPLYLGDESIGNYIPSEFYHNIKGMELEEISDLIKSSSNDELIRFRKSLRDFIMDNGLKDFDNETFTKIICQEIL